MQQSTLTVPAPGLLRRLGSTRVTPWLLAALACSALAGEALDRAGALVALPLALLAGNLLASIATHAAFRMQPALLAFHLALLAVLLLAGAGRLTYLAGRCEVLEGDAFDGRLIDGERGPLHRDRLAEAAFVNAGFRIEYAPGRKRGRTDNTVRWRDTGGPVHEATIGDHRALVRHGYRFYTSPNKGFAPVFEWRPDAGAAVAGAVHLPSFPAHEHGQAREWRLPQGPSVWVLLKSDAPLLETATADVFRKPATHRIVVRSGDARAELAPGESLRLPGGVLAYRELRTWMGYRVAYDATLPWLLAAGVVAVGALGAHVALRWRRGGPLDGGAR